MAVVIVSSGYRVVIPKDVREKLGIRSGQKLEAFAVRGRIEYVPVQPIESLRGRYPDLPALERETQDADFDGMDGVRYRAKG